MKLASFALALALALLSTACGGEDICSAIYIPALEITVVDDGGTVIEDATVTVTLEGEDPIDCPPDEDGVRTCGPGSGEYDILAEAPGYASMVAMVSVGADGCDVLTEEVEIVLSIDNG